MKNPRREKACAYTHKARETDEPTASARDRPQCKGHAIADSRAFAPLVAACARWICSEMRRIQQASAEPLVLLGFQQSGLNQPATKPHPFTFAARKSPQAPVAQAQTRTGMAVAKRRAIPGERSGHGDSTPTHHTQTQDRDIE
ncbi:hypothetical protein [Paraburkholderia tropica]|uniref:hypothetical protein n=1 Tax=Paraburkholderia tropica TaxID=92647 RepID=UPI001CC4DAEA|nr:hypothetical protein [Paraburkholderia tropica]